MVAICEAADDDAIKRIAVDAAGKAVLLRVVRELEDGYTTRGERAEMQRILKLVSEVASELVEGPSGPTVEVEVITFLHGGATLDAIGTTVFGKGTKGHTAVIVGGLAYSYEDGWQTGQTKDEYLAKNSCGPASGRCSRSREDARKIQKKLNESANEGVYLLGGDICTDATARALEDVLGDLKSGFDVQGFPPARRHGEGARSARVPRAVGTRRLPASGRRHGRGVATCATMSPAPRGGAVR